MDSPSSALTNVLKIDNLSRVPYAIYGPVTSNDTALPGSQSHIDRQCETLREAERTLRAVGILVLSDFQRRCLWVFHIHGIAEQVSLGGGLVQEMADQTSAVETKDEHWLQLEERLKGEWGLEELSTGVFLSSSLTPLNALSAIAIPRSTTEIHSAASSRLPSAPVTPSTGPNTDGPVTIDLTLDEPLESIEGSQASRLVFEEPNVYRNIITAVLSALTFSLSSREGFTPLNTRTLVSPLSLPTSREYKSEAERKGKEEILPSQPITSPDLITPIVLELEAYMTSLGTLVIIPHSEKQSAIRRIDTCGFTPASLENREVFIAPWGEWGRIIPLGDGLDDHRAEQRWKESVLSYLKDQGIISSNPTEAAEKTVLQEAIEQGKWLYIEIWHRSLTDSSMGDLYRVFWPEALLFIRTSEGDRRMPSPKKDEENPDFWKHVFEDPEYSRLAWGKLASIMTTLDLGGASVMKKELDSGAEWWEVESAIKWGQEWFKGREERARQMEKIEEMKKELADVKSQEGKPVTETLGVADRGKVKVGLDNKSGPGGVYPTPPDAAAVATTLPGASAGISSTGVADMSNTFTTGGGVNVMDVDWPGDQVMAVDTSLMAEPPIGGEANLFGEEMDDMDLLMKVTEDDFDFFDNPGFGDGGDNSTGIGGMDLDVGPVDLTGVNGMPMATESVDLHMESPPLVQSIAPAISTCVPPRQPETRVNKRSRSLVAVEKAPTTPENQVRTPPLSPHRAIGLLVPGYSAPMNNGAEFTPPATGSFKTPATTVSTNGSHMDPTKRRMSMYSPIMFTESVEMADRKYAPGGRFFLPESAKRNELKVEDVTKIERQKNLKRKRKRSESAPASTAPYMSTATPVIIIDDDEAVESSNDWEEDDSEESDADDTTEDEGSRYHTSPDRAGAHQPLGFLNWTGRKRKWPLEGGEMEIDLPEGFPQHRDVAIGVNGEVDIVPEIAPPPWRTMQPDPLNESLVGVFQDMTLTSEALILGSLGEAEFLDVAAIVSQQMAGWVYTSWRGKNETTSDEEEDEETSIIRRRCGRDQFVTEDVVKSVFKEGSVVRCNLETYAAIADSIQEPPPLPPPPPLNHFNRGPQGLKPNLSQRRNKGFGEIANASWDIFHIPLPHVRLQRGDNVLEMLPSALHFWETFSLAPISGSKNVISVCFHPASSALEEGADFLLDRVSSSYEAGRFGVHVRANIDGLVSVKNGLIPVETAPERPSYETGMKALQRDVENFGANLAHGVADEGMNIVVYVINPFDHPSALVDICTAFYRMKRLYEICIATLPDAQPNHLALQVVPANFVAHKIGIVMRVGIVHRLAVEVYSRCIPTDAGISYEEAKRATSPPIQLARPIPKSIEFQLTPDPSPALLKENQLLHVAYSQSLDERWVVAAWSDNTGALQKTNVINLGRRNTSVLRPFSEVMSEIWDITDDLIKYPAVKWRLCITKVGATTTMPDDEIQIWQTLAENHERISATYLLAATLASPFRITEFLPELKMENFWPQAALYNTPPLSINTPTPTSIVSPDATATTPGGASESATELDSDAELIDAVDETWGVVLGHGFPPADDEQPRRYRPSGLLLRRDGGEEGGGWRVTVCFSVVEGGGKEVVREVMEMWRGLGVLGGFQGGRGGVPWMLGWCEGAEKVARVM